MGREPRGTESIEVEFGSSEKEWLRSTPEGDLWISVLLDAFDAMDIAIEWRCSNYPRIRSSLEREHRAGRSSDFLHRMRLRELERERRRREAQIQSCARFFFCEDSRLEFICEEFGYPIDVIRDRARERLARLEGVPGLELDPGVDETAWP